MDLVYLYVETPLGPILLAGRDGAIHEIRFPTSEGAVAPDPHWRRDDAALIDARAQLEDYFAGRRQEFDLDLDVRGTAFQERVWRELRTIPYATTVTYGELAARIGRPSASRAVGAANGANPLPIVVPCHRVIGADGSLTGFGGGIPIKRALLEHEQRTVGHAMAQGRLF